MKQDIKPTRSELRLVKRRLLVARRGHKLLKRKQESLMLEFLSSLDKYRRAQSDADTASRAARRLLAIAEMASGRMGVWGFSMTRAGKNMVDPGVRIFMGVRLPDIRPASGKIPSFIPGEVPQNLEAARAADDLIVKLVLLASVEAQVRVLLDEIERTKRRVNALELRIIPELDDIQRFIQTRLDEIERESLFSFKRIRSKIAART